MRGMRRFVGRKVLVTTDTGDALAGVLWRATRDGLELRNVRELSRDFNVDGIVWVPASSVKQANVKAGE